jgi:hypothetical protein
LSSRSRKVWPQKRGRVFREAHGGLDAVGVHVRQPVLLFPCARADLIERCKLHAELGEPDRRGQHHQRGNQAVVEPDIAPGAVRILLPAPLRTAVAHFLARHPGTPVLEARREPGLPQIRRLQHVVVYGDDPRDVRHATLPLEWVRSYYAAGHGRSDVQNRGRQQTAPVADSASPMPEGVEVDVLA